VVARAVNEDADQPVECVGPWALTPEEALPVPPLTGYPLPDAAYTDDPTHIACLLPAITSHAGAPLRLLPLGTRWRCGDCGTVHVVVMTSLGRVWEIERVLGVWVGG
jgi:hypothetical protein